MATFSLPAGTVTFLMSDDRPVKLRCGNRIQTRCVSGCRGTARSLTMRSPAMPACVRSSRARATASSRSSAAPRTRWRRRLRRSAGCRQAWPDGMGLSVRIALHTADAQLRDEGNYFGIAFERCARIRAVARGGQTLLSQGDARPRRRPAAGGRELLDCGAHRLRDLGRPEHIFALAASGPSRSAPGRCGPWMRCQTIFRAS